MTPIDNIGNLEEYKRSQRGRASLSRGKNTERDVREELKLLGLCNVAEVATPFKVTKHLGKGLMQGYFEKKVTGRINPDKGKDKAASRAKTHSSSP